MSHVNDTQVPSGVSVSGSPSQGGASGPDWERFCKELLAERERLRAELAEIKIERDLYRKALQTTLPVEEVAFTKEDILAQRGRQPSLYKLINDLEKDLGS
jgi:hypothetical protein